MDFAALVLARIEELGLDNVNQAEDRFGFSRGYLRGVVRDDKKRAIPSIEKAKVICEALGLDFYIGRGRPSGPTQAINSNQFATVARYAASAAAGDGAINLERDPIDYLAFSRDWLVQNGIRPDSCVLITARGDSMAPAISDGDLVMIDRRRTEIRSGRIYVYNDPADGTRVKRIEVVPGSVVIIRSDNHDQERFPPEFHTGPAMNAISQNILGEVIWSGHTWR